MRSLILIAYDISDDKRRTKIFQQLKGFGEAIQYSLFQCKLTGTERAKLRAELWEQIDHSKDRIVMIDIGPEQGRAALALDAFGQPMVDSSAHQGMLIV
ncbi:CRISPR-associated endonuclease Cas2 [Tuwongella immobilis]|uniref:CRISPR-associated endoribonuclease Cas2 n=1 Tax=Tuwongella immobilis TaxID=692036 RepID=A0A6C2YKS1_9BACT|nr:CRISPR-associated endonuclease Cas2 [Tuwongella immobilis]VIP01705.1 crispr-associated protein cas2 : CRISPR-associated endoribonuclease Cas2 OS=Candidatus Methylomirabilis oxyfera GN=cas2 PE=3 SV=1: CRISPR_Cas2 [Tuwongella immobilis]VTR99203.1 crispr-associated protein cas2 : CRISPR-associated endoribonuclease Cas2 OS=Candidatus Methylomirabilis oxyfera GN=cas2 PE=3 SV=1: CRISPR_Cas2 [Tuwongella immobilis]